MEYIKQNFNINDLEQLSGVKAHTIRIWEKRYSILVPKRTDTNIRIYGIDDLQKILNISFLNDNGYKISRIAKLSDKEVAKMVRDVSGSDSEKNRSINIFKIAMINFDQELFSKTYEDLTKTKTFSQIFNEIFIPLLDEIGILWQTQTINPIHEHFIAGMLKEKLYKNISMLEKRKGFSNKELYVLFLPDNEIHEFGLLFLYHELLLRKQKTIFLSPGLPLKDLKFLNEIHPNPIFASYLTVAPKEVQEFLNEFEREICENSYKKLLLFGAKVQAINPIEQAAHIKIYKSISEFLSDLDLKEV